MEEENRRLRESNRILLETVNTLEKQRIIDQCEIKNLKEKEQIFLTAIKLLPQIDNSNGVKKGDN